MISDSSYEERRRFVLSDIAGLRSAEDFLGAIQRQAIESLRDTQVLGASLVLADRNTFPDAQIATPCEENDTDILRGIAERILEIPVSVNTAGTFAAIGEYRFGVILSVASAIVVQPWPVPHASIIVNGELWGGAMRRSGNLAHSPLGDLGWICWCGGRGCLENVASASSILAALCGAGAGEECTISNLADAVSGGSLGALRAVEDAAYATGQIASGVVNAIDPQVVVVDAEPFLGSPSVLAAFSRGMESGLSPSARYPEPIGALLTTDAAVVRGALSAALMFSTAT